MRTTQLKLSKRRIKYEKSISHARSKNYSSPNKYKFIKKSEVIPFVKYYGVYALIYIGFSLFGGVLRSFMYTPLMFGMFVLSLVCAILLARNLWKNKI